MSEKIPTAPYVARNLKYKQALARRLRIKKAEIEQQNNIEIRKLLDDEKVKQDLVCTGVKAIPKFLDKTLFYTSNFPEIWHNIENKNYE